MTIPLNTGYFLSLLCVCCYAINNIFCKICSNMGLNPFLMISLASLFAGIVLLIKGGASSLALPAMKSKYTWIYGFSEFLELCFGMSIYFYISATEGALVTRIAVILSIIASHIFLKRNTFMKSYLGLVPLSLGLVIVFSGIEEHLTIVLMLSIAVAIFRNLYYFSIELNHVGYETESYTHDSSVIGYIVGITGICVFTLLLISALISYFIGHNIVAILPTLPEFMDVDLYIMASILGIFILAAMKFLEFKAIQSVKTEIFQCIVATSPLITLLMELSFKGLSFYETSLSFTPTLTLSTILIVAGSIYIIWKKHVSSVTETNKGR